jgi:hypothetical protein
MRKYSLLILLFFVYEISFAQFGIKAGINFANITNASSINSSSRSGFHAGLLLAPPSSGIVGSRTELIFSRQGYNYKTGTNTGNVNLDYIMLPQFMAINITRYFQLQLGAQMAYLINAKVDSSTNGSSGTTGNNLLSLYNRFDYGFGGGIEIHPVGGLLIGARFNISLGKLYNTDYSTGTPPSFIPNVDVKNNVFQLFAGWTFGKQASVKSKKKQQP